MSLCHLGWCQNGHISFRSNTQLHSFQLHTCQSSFQSCQKFKLDFSNHQMVCNLGARSTIANESSHEATRISIFLSCLVVMRLVLAVDSLYQQEPNIPNKRPKGLVLSWQSWADRGRNLILKWVYLYPVHGYAWQYIFIKEEQSKQHCYLPNLLVWSNTIVHWSLEWMLVVSDSVGIAVNLEGFHLKIFEKIELDVN
jgi:hypothetical protein